jgi:hypothetical protein
VVIARRDATVASVVTAAIVRRAASASRARSRKQLPNKPTSSRSSRRTSNQNKSANGCRA